MGHHVVPIHANDSFEDKKVIIAKCDVAPTVVSSGDTVEDVSERSGQAPSKEQIVKSNSRRVSCMVSETDDAILINQAILDLNRSRRSFRKYASNAIRMEAVRVNERLLAYKLRIVSKYRQRRRSGQFKIMENITGYISDEESDTSTCSSGSSMTGKIDNTNRCVHNYMDESAVDMDTFANEMNEESISIMSQAYRMKRMALLLNAIDFHQKILLTEMAQCRSTKLMAAV